MEWTDFKRIAKKHQVKRIELLLCYAAQVIG